MSGHHTALPSRSMKPGSVPTARVAPILETLIKDRWPYSSEDVLSCSDLAAGCTVLADKVGCDPTTIVKIVEEKYEGADFDLVDKLFCALGRPDVWRGKLLDVYEVVDLARRKCACPGCDRGFQPGIDTLGRPKHTIYCSTACKHAAWKIAHGKHTKRMSASKRDTRHWCRNGHDKRVVGLDKRGTCKQCLRDRSREHREGMAVAA